MTNSKFVRPALALLTLATISACSKSAATTSTSPTPSTSTAAAAPAPAARPFTAAQVAMGDSIFHAISCKNCHGPDGKGAANGPNLTGPTFLHVDGTYPSIVNLITTGVPAANIKDPSHKIPMGARGGRTPLTDDQIKAVAAYVFTLSHH